jgi:hypothetical protein
MNEYKEFSCLTPGCNRVTLERMGFCSICQNTREDSRMSLLYRLKNTKDSEQIFRVIHNEISIYEEKINQWKGEE